MDNISIWIIWKK